MLDVSIVHGSTTIKCQNCYCAKIQIKCPREMRFFVFLSFIPNALFNEMKNHSLFNGLVETHLHVLCSCYYCY